MGFTSSQRKEKEKKKMSTFNVTPLYGGAVTTVIPAGFLDASLFRSVPDTQEVYVNGRRPGQDVNVSVEGRQTGSISNYEVNDGLGFNESIIVDLLQRVEADDDRAALDIHLNEIDSLNGGSHSYRVVKYELLEGLTVEEPPTLPGNNSPVTTAQACITVQSANKWGDPRQRETVTSCVGLIRLSDVATDVLITINVPLTSDEEKELSLGTVTETSDDDRIPRRTLAAYRLLLEMLRNFKVVDRGLFV